MVEYEECKKCIEIVKDVQNEIVSRVKKEYESKLLRLQESLNNTETALNLAIYTLKHSNSDEQIIGSFNIYLKEFGYCEDGFDKCREFFKKTASILKETQDIETPKMFLASGFANDYKKVLKEIENEKRIKR